MPSPVRSSASCSSPPAGTRNWPLISRACWLERWPEHDSLYHLNENIAHLLEGFLESAVPLIAGLAEVIGLFIIVTSLVKATYHYVRTTFFHDRYDFHHEMSTGLTTALEFLMSAEIAKTFLLQNLESVIPLAATFALRALMSLLLHVEMRADHKGEK